MSIPLDRLYNYIENIAKEINNSIIIYHFYPHGSKNIENLQELKGEASWQDRALNYSIYCHDQEPLTYKLYQDVARDNSFTKLLKSLFLKIDTNLMINSTMHDRVCLVHSEKRSNELAKYQHHPSPRCVDVYYWCHALVALDWFRYAKHVAQQKQVSKTFLIYNRAWSGTREYRLKFVDLLIDFDLQNHCRATINPIEPELDIHYNLHQFANPVWRPNVVLEDYFPNNSAHSSYSADFDINDYEATDIEVVLETLFDDGRLHLTEKSLRPIACAQPFILASTHGSLEYLRSYGFKTFADVWDEGYDLVEDPAKRLIQVVELMKQIANWDSNTKKRKISQARAVAEYNKQRFFSEDFFNQVVSELTSNLTTALTQMTSDIDTSVFVDRWKKWITHHEILNWLMANTNLKFPTLDQINNVLAIADDVQKSKQ